MQRIETKHAIIGAGAMGSAAAYHLARRGEPVLLLEQFPLGHDRGSSHGAARITRHSYADARYARLMPAAFRGLERAGSRRRPAALPPHGRRLALPGRRRLRRPTWPPAWSDWTSRTADDRRGVEPDRTRPSPSPRPTTSSSSPTPACSPRPGPWALQVELARSHGGEKTQVLDDTPVRRIDLDGPRPVIVTDALEIVAERLIVSAGAWVKRLLPELPLPLQVTRQQVLYFRPADPAPFADRPVPRLHLQGSRATRTPSTACPNTRAWA